jgi:hypothetical protein
MDFIKKNIIVLIMSTVLFIFLAYGIGISFVKDYYLNKDNNVLFTVGEVVDFEKGARVSPSIIYRFYINNEERNAKLDYSVAAENSSFENKTQTNYLLKSHIGNNFFVKYNVVKPKFNRIYLSMPVAEDFQYVEGQTWKTIPR